MTQYTILIVDDSPVLRRLLERRLTLEGYDILQAVNGLEAIKIVQEKLPDLVLMEGELPTMDGFSACEYIKQQDTFQHIPILLLTQNSEEEYMSLLIYSTGTTRKVKWLKSCDNAQGWV